MGLDPILRMRARHQYERPAICADLREERTKRFGLGVRERFGDACGIRHRAHRLEVVEHEHEPELP
jgi:hypothetical protein